MAWEYWRKNLWLTLIFIVPGTAILVIPFGRLMPATGAMGFLAFIPLLFAMIGQVVLAMSNIRKDRLGFPQELYAKPVGTSSLVALRMALAFSAAVGMYLCQVLLIWAASGISLPLWWGPFLALAMATAWTHAVVWSLPGLAVFQVIGLYLVVVASIVYYGRCVDRLVELGGDLTGPDPGSGVRGLYTLGMVVLTGLAYSAALVGVRCDRRGDRISLARLHEWISDRIYAVRQTDRPFRSARSAQFSIEWHRKGFLLPALNALSFAVYGMLVVWVKDVTLADGVDFLLALAMVNILAYPILAAILVNTKERFASQDLFWATRPVRDNALLLVRLKVAIASLLASWGVWLAGAIIISGLVKQEGLINLARIAVEADRSEASPLLLVAVRIGWVALLTWTAVGIVGSLHMTGRRGVAMLWMVPLWTYPIWRIIIRQDLIFPETAGLIEAAACYVTGISCLTGTALVYWAALRKGRINRRLGLTVLGTYLVACYLLCPYPDGWARVWMDGNPGAVVLYAGLMTLPLLPLALGPLAVAWNRHR